MYESARSDRFPSVDLIIRGGCVLNPTRRALEPADILIDRDRIAAIEPDLPARADVRTIDASGCIVLPGLINAHTHAHNNLSRGLARKWSLEDQLNHGPALLSHRSVEDQYVSAAIGAIEMLKTGCTAAYDLFMALPSPTEEGVEAVARAYIDAGMRAVIAPALADIVFQRTVPGLLDLLPPDLRRTVEHLRAAPAHDLLSLSEHAIRRWDGSAGGRIHVAVAPTIPGQCSEEFLSGCLRLIRDYDVGLHTHLVESKVQVVHGLRRWGTTVVEHLDEIGLLGPGFTGAHAVWLTRDDIAHLAQAGASVVHNPASNLRLGNGIAPIRELLDTGMNVALGTDGSMSSDNQDMFEAMRFAALVSRIRFPYDQEHWLDGDDSWRMATLGSSQALGMASDIGAIACGRKADLALLRSDSIFLQPLNDPTNALVYAETGASVQTVVVDGRVVMERGKILTLDEQAIYRQAQEAAERLARASRSEWLLARRLTPYLASACQAAAAAPFPVSRTAAPSA